jgi:hypothetical protein
MKSNLVPLLLGVAVVGGGAFLLMSMKGGQKLVLDSEEILRVSEAAMAGQPAGRFPELTVWAQYDEKAKKLGLVEYRAQARDNLSMVVLNLVDPMSGTVIATYQAPNMTVEEAAKYLADSAKAYLSSIVLK